jgi:8-oxo-dGTP pyrophosphatase MutT (NUDIX family)
MYKIFINDKPFILANSGYRHVSLKAIPFSKEVLLENLANAEFPNFEGVVLLCNDLENAFAFFCNQFKVMEASGGLVFNELNELLLIERLGVWDLPKGKIEKNEIPENAAIREVEEECGINNLTLGDLVCESYHTYTLKNNKILKRTFWYKMKTTFRGSLIPQTEENITKAEWKNFDKTMIDKLNTYESIKEVLRIYFQTSH